MLLGWLLDSLMLLALLCSAPLACLLASLVQQARTTAHALNSKSLPSSDHLQIGSLFLTGVEKLRVWFMLNFQTGDPGEADMAVGPNLEPWPTTSRAVKKPGAMPHSHNRS